MWRRTLLPARWPNRSLTSLKPSRSQTTTASERRFSARAPASLSSERKSERALGQIGQIVGGDGSLQQPVRQRVLDRQRHLGTDGQQDAQVVLGEGVAVRPVKRQHAQQPVDAVQRTASAARKVLYLVGSFR